MLIDEVIISVRAGNGGKGAVAFNSNLRSLGPTGGSGGRGGSVYAEGTSDLAALAQFRFKKDLAAEDGMNGRPQFRDGTDGKELVLKIPVGTVIKNLKDGSETEITKVGERAPLAQGGRGGKGNFHFRSSKNTSPQEFQPGLPGESFEFRLELKLIADVGLVGLPNTGKSSLLNELTRAQSKVANYHFTTLEPHLGAYYELILADIPGLIEGSAQGKGLGIKFLRHIERTRILFHCISAESESPEKDYALVRAELGSYSKALLEKEEYIFLTKSDLVSAREIKEKLAALKKVNAHALSLSIHDEESLNTVREILNKIKKDKIRS
jgi:GTP-binding protein